MTEAVLLLKSSFYSCRAWPSSRPVTLTMWTEKQYCPNDFPKAAQLVGSRTSTGAWAFPCSGFSHPASPKSVSCKSDCTWKEVQTMINAQTSWVCNLPSNLALTWLCRVCLELYYWDLPVSNGCHAMLLWCQLKNRNFYLVHTDPLSRWYRFLGNPDIWGLC